MKSKGISRRDVIKLGAVSALASLTPGRIFAADRDSSKPKNQTLAPWQPPKPEAQGYTWTNHQLESVDKDVTIGKSTSPGQLINGIYPGPEIRLNEGDVYRAVVQNKCEKDPMTLHWHGLIVPNYMDGVPGVTQAPIEPTHSVAYEFPVVQNGSYWYHSHFGLEEQVGMAGPLIINAKEERLEYDSEHTIFLTDWLGQNPYQVLNGLEGQKVSKAIDKLIFPPKGIAKNLAPDGKSFAIDIYYPYHLINGKTANDPDVLSCQPGEKIRLRFINAGASSYFRIMIEGHELEVVAKDGNYVQPVNVNNFVIAVAERYDIIVTVKEKGLFKISAAALGQVGGAIAYINCGKQKKPKVTEYKIPNWQGRTLNYSMLKALESTIPPDGETVFFDLKLEGDMVNYRWSINGQYYPDAQPLFIKQGQRIRVDFTNKTMMAHPMHLHGHFFRFLSPVQDKVNAPLMDTINVPPGHKVKIEFYADNPGKWICHCHILYHLEKGMARLFEYVV